MIIDDVHRKIKCCIEEELKVNANLSDSEIDNYVESITAEKLYVM